MPLRGPRPRDGCLCSTATHGGGRGRASTCSPQRGGGLDERLHHAFADVGGPALLVGMDTPQLTPALLRAGLAALAHPDHDATLGPAWDGGYWSIGLKRPCAEAFLGIPMSQPTTCEQQRARLVALGLRVHDQPELRDVDTIADARAVARQAPASRFAHALASIDSVAA